MTEPVKIVPTTITVSSGKPSTAFGQLANAPLESGAAIILTRAALSPEIPTTAVVAPATLTFKQIGALSGSVSVTVQRVDVPFTAKTTWNTRPSTLGTAVTLTKSSPGAGTLWQFPVTPDVQDYVSGAVDNLGWKVTTNSSTRFYVDGAVAASGKPTLTFDYDAVAAAPQNLKPNGAAMSVDKPVLGWDPIPGTTAVQVQVDAAADAVSPDFDSGEVPPVGAAAAFALASSAYAGLADGASTSWRVRVRTPGGLSDWSDWATFPRHNKLVITVTNPGATSADGTPPFQATVTGSSTMESWRVTLRDVLTNALLDDSKPSDDAAIEWTPAKGVTKAGQQGKFHVEVLDDVVRVATPGDPVAAVADQTFTLVLSDAIAPLDTFDVEQRGASPVVWLVGARSEISDEVAIFRRKVDVEDAEHQIARVPGLDVFTGDAFEWADITAAPFWRYEYRVAPVVDNEVASGGLVKSIVPGCRGKWLIAEDDHTALVFWGQDGDVPEATDLAVVHQPATGNAPAVRRRLSRPPKSSTESGDIVDVAQPAGDGGDLLADDMLRIVDEFRDSDQARLYRLVIGHLNLRVIAGNFESWPAPSTSLVQRVATASFSWWGQD